MSTSTPARTGLTPRELAGSINRSKQIYLWIQWNDANGAYFMVPKTFARSIVQDAREKSAQAGTSLLVTASERAGKLFIGSLSQQMRSEVGRAEEKKPVRGQDEEDE